MIQNRHFFSTANFSAVTSVRHSVSPIPSPFVCLYKTFMTLIISGLAAEWIQRVAFRLRRKGEKFWSTSAIFETCYGRKGDTECTQQVGPFFPKCHLKPLIFWDRKFRIQLGGSFVALIDKCKNTFFKISINSANICISVGNIIIRRLISSMFILRQHSSCKIFPKYSGFNFFDWMIYNYSTLFGTKNSLDVKGKLQWSILTWHGG